MIEEVTEHSWPWRPDLCPADDHFTDWLVAANVQDSTIFHMGTGGHHHVGRHVAAAQSDRNVCLGLTMSYGEADVYARMAITDPALGRRYKVLFGDIHQIEPRLLPALDVVTLFHLCETQAEHLTELSPAGVIEALCSRMRPGGRMLFYTGSSAFDRLLPAIEDELATGVLTAHSEYGSLLVTTLDNFPLQPIDK